MKTTDFTENPQVTGIIRNMEEDGVREKTFSDVLDTSGNQYIELVQEGGRPGAIFLTYGFSMTLLPVLLSFYTRRRFNDRGLQAAWARWIVDAAAGLALPQNASIELERVQADRSD